MTRWGILSTARINGSLLEGARVARGVEVAAVASRDRARADAFAQAQGIPRAHGSYEALLADDGVDAVYIPLPNSLHHEWTMRALAAGKHVLCEKPYTRHAAELEEAFDLAERNGLVLSEAFMWRHNPQTRRLLELLPEIGELQTIRATFAFSLREPTNIRLSRELEGGSLMDLGCYCVSGARLLAGEPERVYGEQFVGPSGVDIRFTGTLRHPGGVVAEFTSSLTYEHQGLEAIGTRGRLFVPDPWHCTAGMVEVNGRAEHVPRANSYALELEDVGAAIRGESRPLLGRADARGQARTIEALYAAADRGAPVSLEARSG
jgi:xylose dehydrogenase (NAD/NADP)